ncbi:outer membrane protein assembly factor BamB family protein [Acuticoccus mangrovi]|uniref:PQQ-binding-like beta-propeller repeat protein n=1 Tax=Acuticoccus mangrovi TaxID=2796142 RepID=A0A934IQ52_9HYPH|nr:PQQ-binding-like beta-propeller repeat protein [Acuticoccus mangrovi]MBJ3776646.1 PQQ-binding-like beta-propeller repeat protein [Acuticoccus mangrovi]
MRVVPFVLAAALTGCGSISDLNPFGAKDEHLVGERTTVFSTNTEMPEDATPKPASVGPARANNDWPQPGGNAQNDPGHLAYSGGAVRAWRASVGGSGSGGLSVARGTPRISARPVVSGDRVFVYAPNGTVTALSLGSGTRIWSTSLRPDGERDAAAGGGVTVDGNRVFVATGYGEMAALDAQNGQEIWRRGLDTPARGAPTAGAGKVFVVSQKNKVFAIDQADGTEAFTYDGIPEQAGLLATSSPAISGSTVVIPYSSGEVMAFSTDTGEPKWQSFVTRSMRTLAVSGLTDVSGSPVIDGGTVYATGVSGRTIAVNLSDGSMKWERNIGSAHTPIVSGDALFLVDLADRMVALNKSSGETLWMTELPKPKKKKDRAYAGPLLAGGSLYAISNDGRLAQLNPKDGQVVADRTIGSAAYSAPILASGQMIIVSDAGEITALR